MTNEAKTGDLADRWLAIVNPAAGGGRCGKRADAALERLRRAGFEIDVRRTTRAGEASELARAGWDEGYRKFLGVGGDGTGYEIVNGLFPHVGDARPTLGLLPLGTGNSFLRDFGITSAEGALAALEKRHTRTIDVVRATHTTGELYYINLLSLGFSAEVGELTNRRFKPFGPAGYVAAVFLTAARLQSPVFPVKVDGGELDARPCVLLSFSNSRYTAGTMMMAPHADTGDGALDVIRIAGMGRVSFVKQFPSIFAGKHVDKPEVEEGRATHVELELDGPVDVMVDGEIERLQLERLDVLKGALEVVA